MSRGRLIGLQVLFGWLNLALAIPSIYLMFGMPLVMRQYGWSGTEIGLFQLAGLPAVFLFGGHARSEPTRKVGLRHGDVMVWGGEDRLRFHGVNPLKEGEHPVLGARRINLTLRKAGHAD